MSQFQLFDSISLKMPLQLDSGSVAPIGSSGAIVEVFNDGEAYLVELFGGWVKADRQGDFVPVDGADAVTDPEAFMETIGVETVYPEQIHLVERETLGVRA
jgi:hypothetical protein